MQNYNPVQEYDNGPLARLSCSAFFLQQHILTLYTDKADHYRALSIMSRLETLTSAARIVEEAEDEAENLRKKARSVHSLLEAVWPEDDKAPSFPADVNASILANEYYIQSLPQCNYSDQFKVNVLFLAESAALTPAAALGKPFTMEGIPDDVLRDEMSGLLQQHHIGHVNLVHCPTYGELPFLDLDPTKLLEDEDKSIDCGTPQFWKVLLVMSGYYDKFASGAAEDDPLRNEALYKDSAEFVIATGATRDPVARAQRVKNRIKVLEEMKNRGHVLADVCPVPLYAGIGNNVKRWSEKNKRWYLDKKKKIKPTSKREILQVAWDGYANELVRYYKPRRLVILGKSIHEAIGGQVQSLVESFGGEYVGFVKHPSWNGYYGNNIMPLLCELRKIAAQQENTDILPKDSSSEEGMDRGTDESDAGDVDPSPSAVGEGEDNNIANFDFSSLDIMSSYNVGPRTDHQQHGNATGMCNPDEEPESNMSFSLDLGGVDTSGIRENTAVMDWLAETSPSKPSPARMDQ